MTGQEDKSSASCSGEKQHICGVFIDPSEYRRNNFDFLGSRLRALADLGARKVIKFLQTDVSIGETQSLIHRSIKEAFDELKKSALSPLKSIPHTRLDLFRSLPNSSVFGEILRKIFEDHMAAGLCESLSVSEVDPSVIFDAYFHEKPPFDNPKKKMEFPDAFTHQRLIMWAEENSAEVCVVGPDPDLKRICDAHERLRYFEKIEALLDYINRPDELVRRLKAVPEDLVDQIFEFVSKEFANLEFTLTYNDHGEVENISVGPVEVVDVYALEANAEEVLAEAEVKIGFSGDFSYEDPDSGFYDREDDRRYMTDYVHGNVEDNQTVSITFTFSIGDDGKSIISNPKFSQDVIVVEEEDRGDYGQWK